MTNSADVIPGAFWREIVTRPTLDDFARAFRPDVTFETTTCRRKVHGPANMHTLLSAMSSLNTSLVFTRELARSDRTNLEWVGRAFDIDVAGITVVQWDDARRSVSVELNQRPLAAVVAFAVALAQRDLPGFSAADFSLANSPAT